MNNTIINIGRQFGSGGLLVGEKLAGKLNFGFFDKELINLASKESGLSAEFFEQADERRHPRFLGHFFRIGKNIMDSSDLENNYLTNNTLFKIQSDVIRSLAEKQSCVFVGRCADYILRENTSCFNIFVTANIEDRIARITERLGIPSKTAKSVLEKLDKKRAAYYNFYTNKTWGAAESYHLCVNTSVLGIDKTTNLIASIINCTGYNK
ncbi:MAG: cytidylate kinase-like family protein [Bacteroidales bacterium]|jgi:cytidylate kinase|nr:cytidylate kinase-like family protein [Bacteroidales bacterium]